jgi:cation:H+ antiporter
MILLAIFVFYMIQLTRVRKPRDEGSLGEERRKLHHYVFLTLVGAVGVIASAFFIVDPASLIAASAGVPPVVIGATIVAFGTSISSDRKDHFNLALGSIVGSCFINITFILGVSLVVSPLTVSITAFSNLALFSLITNLFLWYFLSSERMSWREGTILLVLYVMFLIVSLGSSMQG